MRGTGPAMAVVDVGGVITGWTAGATRLLGHRPEQVMGRAAAGLLAGGLSASALGCIRRGNECEERVTLRHRDGYGVEADVRAVPVHGIGGAAGWAVLAVRRDEAAAAVLKEWALAGLPVAVGIYDHEGQLVAINDEALRVVGMRQEDALGLRPGVLSSDHPYHEFEGLLARVLRTGRPSRMDSFVRLPGESRAHAWSAFISPLTDPAGRVRGASVASLDVTEQDRARQRLAVVNAASVRIGTVLDTVETAQQLADVATEQFADFVGVDLLDSDFREGSNLRWSAGRLAFSRAAQRSVEEGWPESPIRPGEMGRYAAESPMAQALATGMPSRHLTDDPDIRRWLEQDMAHARCLRACDVHSLIVVPLLARGSIIGLAQFLRHQTPDQFGADDLLLAEEITARAAICIDNARRYAHERDTALALQRSMLPQRTPPHPAVTVASRYRPTDSRAGVGGDWFDVIPLSGVRVAFVVGDVVGHGIQASAIMGGLRTAVRTLADVDMPPDELLTHLDDVVLRLDREEDWEATGPGEREAGEIGATCLYAVYDPISRRCTIARAGHPAPAVVGPGGTVEFPELPAGPPLGLGGLPFESTELEIPDGVTIAMFTDGLIESRDRDADAGLAWLSGVLSNSATTPLEQLCDDVLDSLLPDTPADDAALLLVRPQALPTSQVATWDLPADPEMVAQARRLASDQLDEWGLEETAFITELVVSELLTNAIRYGLPPIQLRLIHENTLICEVSDTSNTAPHLRRARVFDEGGRGLLLVAHLAQRWGTRHTPSGKTIWAEQILPKAL